MKPDAWAVQMPDGRIDHELVGTKGMSNGGAARTRAALPVADRWSCTCAR